MSLFNRLGIEKIIQGVVNFSKVDIKLVKITEPREDSFLFSLDAHVHRTGPVFATVSAMTVDLAGPGGGIYGKLFMDEFKITPTETRILIENQEIKITNMENFLALGKTLVQQETTELSLVNGQGTVKVLGMKFPIKFAKTCPVPGMAGPRTEFLETTDGGKTVTARIYNPSPIEMDLGHAVFECRNGEGKALARQRGQIFITKGYSEHKVTMEVIDDGSLENAGDITMLQMVGIEVEDDGRGSSWMRNGIKNYDVELAVTPEMTDLIRQKEKEMIEARTLNGKLLEEKQRMDGVAREVNA